MAETYRNYIDGDWRPAAGGATFDARDPADLTRTSGTYADSATEDVDRAAAAAAEAFDGWRGLGVYARAEILRAALALMRERSDVIARVITAENGKTLREARAEVASAVKEMEWQIHEGLRLAGRMMPSAAPGILAWQVRVPLGPVAVIAPWNFPFNVPARKITPALISGNTCVLKPASQTGGVGAAFVRLYADAGLPPGVLNLVLGSGRAVGEPLVRHANIRAVTFTGSTEIGGRIHNLAAEGLKPTQLEMGGCNPLVVLADADLDAAADAACLAAFACAGQWCIATSRAIVECSALDAFRERLVQRARRIAVGAGTRERTDMGPVCGEAQLRHVLDGIARCRDDGATCVLGGERMTDGPLADGCFVAPTIFADVAPESFLAREELFGPAVGLMAAEDFDHAVALANGVKYGLGSSVYTRDLAKAAAFAEASEAGLVHVNLHTAYKEPQLSFGGMKQSGHGIPEAGHTGIEFFTHHKTVYVQPSPK